MCRYSRTFIYLTYFNHLLHTIELRTISRGKREDSAHLTEHGNFFEHWFGDQLAYYCWFGDCPVGPITFVVLYMIYNAVMSKVIELTQAMSARLRQCYLESLFFVRRRRKKIYTKSRNSYYFSLVLYQFITVKFVIYPFRFE